MKHVASSTEYLCWFYFHGIITSTLLCGRGPWNSVKNTPLPITQSPCLTTRDGAQWLVLLHAYQSTICNVAPRKLPKQVIWRNTPTRLRRVINVKITQTAFRHWRWIDWLNVCPVCGKACLRARKQNVYLCVYVTLTSGMLPKCADSLQLTPTYAVQIISSSDLCVTTLGCCPWAHRKCEKKLLAMPLLDMTLHWKWHCGHVTVIIVCLIFRSLCQSQQNPVNSTSSAHYGLMHLMSDF